MPKQTIDMASSAQSTVENDVTIRLADLSQLGDQQAVLALTDQYAQNLMGSGKALRPDVRERLIAGLRAQPTTLVFLAWIGDLPVGIATCFVGFSTFEARPLLNVHDLAVVDRLQGQGIGRRLLEAIMHYGIAREYCALTLEVRMDNAPARKLYDRMGFEHVGESLNNETMLFGKLKFPRVTEK